MAKWKNKPGAKPRNDNSHKSDFVLPPESPTSDAEHAEEDSGNLMAADNEARLDLQEASNKFHEDGEGNDSDESSDEESDSGAAFYGRIAAGDENIDFDGNYDDSDNEAPEITEAFLRTLPKAELHCHLDGSLRVDTI